MWEKACTPDLLCPVVGGSKPGFDCVVAWGSGREVEGEEDREFGDAERHVGRSGRGRWDVEVFGNLVPEPEGEKFASAFGPLGSDTVYGGVCARAGFPCAALELVLAGPEACAECEP